jgi:exosortase
LILETSPARNRCFQRVLIFLGLCISSLLVWWKACFFTFRLAFESSDYSYILLIIPITLLLIFLRRGALRGLNKFEFKFAGLILVTALVVGLATKRQIGLSPTATLFASMVALVTWLVGAVVLCFGGRAFRVLMFPMFFLFWLAPFPEIVLDKIVFALQQASASLTGLLFAIVGVPVQKHGVVLSIPGLIIEVAKECSSIRSSLILVVTSMVLVHLLLRSAWRRWLVIVLTIPLSVAKNAVRIFTLSMLATHVDPSFLTGRLHHQGGIVFFSLAVVALWFFIQGLRGRDAGFPPNMLHDRTVPVTSDS